MKKWAKRKTRPLKPRSINCLIRLLPSHQRVSPDYPNHLSNVPCPLPRRIERVRMSIASPHHAAFPKWQEGRHPITARRIAQPPTGDLCHEAPTPAVTRISRSSATGSIDNSPRGVLLH